MFKIKPEQVKLVLLTNKETEDKLLSFLFETGYSWLERTYDELAERWEPHGILLLRDTDTRLKKLFEVLMDKPIIYYFIGPLNLFQQDTTDIFYHTIFTHKHQWSEFEHTFKNMYGKTFTEFITDIK